MLRDRFKVTRGKGRGHGDNRPLKRNLTLSAKGLENFLEVFEQKDLNQILAPRGSHTFDEVSNDEELCISASASKAKATSKLRKSTETTGQKTGGDSSTNGNASAITIIPLRNLTVS